MIKFTRKRLVVVLLVVVAGFFLFVPPVRFGNSTSTVLLDRDGHLLAAAVSDDGMWRFPQCDSVPSRFATCLVQFEDAYFRYHLGVNPVSVLRAAWQNLRAGDVVSGASTITMQLVRLSRMGASRTFAEKLLEMVLAFRTELAYSKKTILRLYVSNAPFGGNVVGVDAAAWRYFGVGVNDLSWAEAATLAVLPNAPGLVFPGKNQHLLLQKRNRLLAKLRDNGIIGDEDYELALLEPAPSAAGWLPQEATHLLTRCIRSGYRGKQVRSTVSRGVQRGVEGIALRHHRRLLDNGICNMAVMVTDNRTGEVVAYLGNVPSSNPDHSPMVDIINAKRSYGSLLKPFLYGYMLNEGLLLPRQLVNDYPVAFSGFAPVNFSLSFDGAVPANEVISRSLNVPAVNMLQEYGLDKFCNNIRTVGIASINRSADHYGLSVILGGAEATMWELAGAYSALSRRAQGLSNPDVGLRFVLDSALAKPSVFRCPNIGVGSAYLTLDALAQATRPDERGNLKHFVVSQKIAWKTGTSRGFRDAWAIGVTPLYTVSVWVGNADGEGRADLVGVAAAAPVMFDVFAMLPASPWYAKPIYDMQTVRTCKQSGFLASDVCGEAIDEDVPLTSIKVLPCTYHRKVFVDRKSGKQVNLSCAKPSDIDEVSWFVLPPIQELFYSRAHIEYRHLPPFRDGCVPSGTGIASMDIIYPYVGADIYIPRSGTGEPCESVWRATHRNPKATIYWHLNSQYIGATTGRHELAVSPAPGIYTLTLVDNQGESVKRRIKIIGGD